MPSSFDLILKNGKCFIDGQLKATDIGISNGIIKSNSKIEKTFPRLLKFYLLSLAEPAHSEKAMELEFRTNDFSWYVSCVTSTPNRFWRLCRRRRSSSCFRSFL